MITSLWCRRIHFSFFGICFNSDHQSLWHDVSPCLARHLPLTNVPIKYPSATNAVTLPELDLLFLPSQTSVAAQPNHQQPSASLTSELGGLSRIASTTHSGTPDASRVSFRSTSTLSGPLHPKTTTAECRTIKSEATQIEEEDGLSRSGVQGQDWNAPTANNGTFRRQLIAGSGPPGSTISSSPSDGGSKDIYSPPRSLSEKPHLGIYLFQVDSIEAFRTQHRKDVRAWIENCTDQQIEWLLVLVTPLSESVNQEKLAKKFHDKLRSETFSLQDVKGKARERFVRICIDNLSSNVQPRGRERAASFDESWMVSLLFILSGIFQYIEPYLGTHTFKLFVCVLFQRHSCLDCVRALRFQ